METVNISMGGYQPPTSVHNHAAEVLGNALRSRLGDGVRFDLDGNMIASQGIKAVDLLTLVENGGLTMCYFASSYLADRVPELGIFDLPFIVKSREQAYAALDGKLGQYLAKQFRQKTGYKVLGFWDNGFRHLTNRLRAIHTPADCQGMKLRTMNSELHKQSFELLGFEPVFVDVKDLVNAARSGEIDAQENPLTNTYNFKTYEHHPYITLSGHFFGVALLLCHNASFESWADNVQHAVIDSSAEATAAQRKLAAEEDKKILKKFDPDKVEIVELTDSERASFVQVTAPVVEKHRAVIGDDLLSLVQ